MSDLAVRSTTARDGASYSEVLSTPLAVAFMFCVVGLAISAVLLPLFAPEEISWVISHLE
jgi:hypothetical protein